MKVRHGITRTVILVGQWAVKIPTMRYGLDAWAWGIVSNISEREWQSYVDWKGKVVPVVHSWLGGMVQVYPRCDPFDPQRMEYPRFPGFAPGDQKPDNYGVLNGAVVCLDYAVPGERGVAVKGKDVP